MLLCDGHPAEYQDKWNAHNVLLRIHWHRTAINTPRSGSLEAPATSALSGHRAPLHTDYGDLLGKPRL